MSQKMCGVVFIALSLSVSTMNSICQHPECACNGYYDEGTNEFTRNRYLDVNYYERCSSCRHFVVEHDNSGDPDDHEHDDVDYTTYNY